MGRPRLSVCCLTADDGARVAAILGMLRPVADEIVVAADSRVDADRLAAYASVADRLFRVEFDYLERHLGWLHAQCSGDWILRIDGDEVPSPALVEALPALVASRDVLQYRIPRRWLFPDPAHWLRELPWWPDLQTRLVRNDGTLRFHGTLHSSAVDVMPFRILDEPIYHLACVVEDVAARRARVRRYETRAPGLQAPGGGPVNAAFYLPEDRVVAPERAPAPDAAAIAAVLDATAPASPIVDVAETPLGESDRYWALRPVAPEDHRASLRPLVPVDRFAPGERREVYVRVRNLGGARWPWAPGSLPEIRLATRWLRGAASGGRPVDDDQPRHPLPSTLPPGGTAIAALDVTAPREPGVYDLEVDLVHEGVAWFGAGCRIRIGVVPD